MSERDGSVGNGVAREVEVQLCSAETRAERRLTVLGSGRDCLCSQSRPEMVQRSVRQPFGFSAHFTELAFAQSRV